VVRLYHGRCIRLDYYSLYERRGNRLFHSNSLGLYCIHIYQILSPSAQYWLYIANSDLTTIIHHRTLFTSAQLWYQLSIAWLVVKQLITLVSSKLLEHYRYASCTYFIILSISNKLFSTWRTEKQYTDRANRQCYNNYITDRLKAYYNKCTETCFDIHNVVRISQHISSVFV